LGQARINSKEVKKNDIFFAIRGRKNDGNKFVEEALKKKASIVIVNKIKKKLDYKKQIKVMDSLKFLTETSTIFRENIDAKIIAITGSCGKTTLKELLGKTLKKISKTTISPKSYNNKYGVPLSLFNLRKNDNYGVLEVGMDKKGEIDYLSKIIKPDISVITNIKKYKRLPCHVLIRSNFLNRKSFLSFFKIFLSLTANFNNVFFFNTKHSSNLINIDLIKGYSGLIFLLLSSIDFIILSGIFEMYDNSLIVRFCSILASFTNFAISLYWSTNPELKSLLFSDFLLIKKRFFKIFI